jgi:hypothetical protein
MPSLKDLFRTQKIPERDNKTAAETYAVRNRDAAKETKLIRVFQSQPIPTQENKIAKDIYAIRNSKDILISTSNPILSSTVFPLIQTKLRGNTQLTRRTRETYVEQQLTGLLPIKLASSPVIYGTDIIRITRRTTPLLRDMKRGTSPGGLLGGAGLLGAVSDFATRLANRVGSVLGAPVTPIPSRIEAGVFNTSPLGGNTNLKRALRRDITSLPQVLANIQNKADGNILGRFLTDSIDGTPDQIGRQAIGAASRAGANLARGLLFGGGRTGINEISNTNISLRGSKISYAQGNTYGNTMLRTEGGKRGAEARIGLQGLLTDIQLEEKTPPVIKFLGGTGVEDFAKKKRERDAINFAQIPTSVPRVYLEALTQNIPKGRIPESGVIQVPLYSKRGRIGAFSLESKLRITTGSDILNQSATWYSVDGTPPPLITGGSETLDDYDLIPFRFYSVSKKTGVSFRATISGLSETVSPSWNASKFVGNPYNFYTYEGVERSVSFTFKLYALNANELIRMWEKLSFLNTFAYPQQYASPGVTPPFMMFTLGNMYIDKEGFVESLTISIDDNTPWATGIPKWKGPLADALDSEAAPLDSDTDYKLPTIIDVQMTIKFVESQSTYWAGRDKPKRVYYYGGVSRDKPTNSENEAKMNPDGSAKEPATT